MDWLWQNKEWLFSGIGVVFIMGIIAVARKIKARPSRQELLRVNDPIPLQEAHSDVSKVSLTLSVEAISRDILSRPPYQRREAAKHYIGTHMSVRGYLYNLTPLDKNNVSVSLTINQKYPIFKVYFHVSVLEMPEFKIIRDGTEMVVSGAIAEADEYSVTLKDVKVFIHS